MKQPYSLSIEQHVEVHCIAVQQQMLLYISIIYLGTTAVRYISYLLRYVHMEFTFDAHCIPKTASVANSKRIASIHM